MNFKVLGYLAIDNGVVVRCKIRQFLLQPPCLVVCQIIVWTKLYEARRLAEAVLSFVIDVIDSKLTTQMKIDTPYASLPAISLQSS
jgi:hypothetical protein